VRKLGHLLFRQHVEVLRAIQNAEFDANRDFKSRAFRGDSGHMVVRFTHVETDYWFHFIEGMTEEECREGPIYYPHYEWNGGEHVVEYSPGSETNTEIARQIPWDEASTLFRTWLFRIRGETGARSELERLMSGQPEHDIVRDPGVNTPFQPAELRLLDAKLDELRDEAIEQGAVAPDKTEAFVEQIQWWKKTARWFQRVNWLQSVGATIGQYGVGVVLDAVGVPPLVRLAASKLTSLFIRSVGTGDAEPPQLPDRSGEAGESV
jgi:hypothetical protein